MLLLIGRRRKVIIFFIGISRYIQERISYPSIFFSDWLGGVLSQNSPNNTNQVQ